MANYKPLGTKFDRTFRNDLNENFTTLDGVASGAKVDSATALTTANAAKTASDNTQAQLDQVVIEGDSSVEAAQARVKADGTTFTTLKDRLNDSDAQLAETMQNKKQVDFVDLLSRLSSLNPKMNVYIKYDAWREIYVNIPISKTQGIGYCFRKNTNDDYVMLMEGFLGDLQYLNVITDQKNAVLTGTYTTLYPPNYWTTTVNDTITTEFTGTKVNFNSYTNDQGGLWEFILNEGKPDEKRKNISVYSATAVTTQNFVLFDNLDYKKYTLKGVFKGDDPANVPSGGAGTGRGWLYYGGTRTQDTKATFEAYSDTFKINKTNDVMYSYSNKEFALSCRPNGSTEAFNWVPEHNAVGTAFKVEDAKLIINGKEVSQANEIYFVDVDSVQVIQKVQGKMPYDTANPLMEVTTFHSFKNGIVNISGKIKFLRDTEIADGYCIMIPYFKSFADKIKSSFENVYTLKTDGTKDYLSESDKGISYVVLHDSVSNENDNLALAVRFNSLEVTNRQGESGLPVENQFSWIEHRSTSMGKLYVEQFKNAIISAGYTYNFDGSFVVCKVPKINAYLL